ncbi:MULTISPECIES: hypothetical protein [unclassified Pseudomonas]|uniref:hypothetical protein n=1 Tax=unclassified Pseudomonas TaxID=196821 RepID=UPI000C88D7C6|nr:MULTISPECIES: hypothetical protein [unclassified Pseudomonas]PMX29262.1 hypothetical protein C1Y23_01560 [Pseudomonas sp. GW460-12]PMX36881.1 hypothetical protein C1Y24_04360 [Pseudomonas sp. MPR-R2A4]PMX43277.1 hypothetical protein C1Y26_03230 [Pseudomonas sp. MPR-R2A7]PMX53322.1 hypothetical protein C1Y17_14255 [Pseudomonas sp. MPR-R2A6]PMX93402.1 hypothetical protein C1Y21_02775 [Pseudomonas sp. MPR-R2A3]
MSNVLNFPPQVLPVEHIDEALFEKNNDAALLLKCFEVVKDVLDVIAEPEYSIEDGDDTHIDLYRAYYALKVLFRRRTGHDAAQVAKDHFDAMGRHLLAGEPRPDNKIPIVVYPAECLPDEAFDGLTDQQLACSAFNYSDRVRRLLSEHSPTGLALDEARTFSIDSSTALRLLVLRLSGGSLESMAEQISRKPGETLQ